MAVWNSAKTRFGQFWCSATRAKALDSAIVLSPDCEDLIFVPQNHILYVQFWQSGQMLWQFDVFPKLDLARFCIVQPGPNQESLLLFYHQIRRSHFSTDKPYTIYPILTPRAEVKVVWNFSNTRFGQFFCHASKS